MSASVAAAEARAAAAKQRLGATAGALQERLAPQALARDAADTLADAGRKALDSGVETARANPGLVVGGVAAAIAFLGRNRLISLVRGKKRAT
jgi:phage host-nuclease inhibitor protein Gam